VRATCFIVCFLNLDRHCHSLPSNKAQGFKDKGNLHEAEKHYRKALEVLPALPYAAAFLAEIEKNR
jgi:hypothetical protein